MFVFSKICVLAFFVICTVTFIQGNFIQNAIDDGVYAFIDAYLKAQYKDNPRKAECVSEDFRRNRIADKFFTTDLFTNNDKFSREIEPYMDAVNLSM